MALFGRKRIDKTGAIIQESNGQKMPDGTFKSQYSIEDIYTTNEIIDFNVKTFLANYNPSCVNSYGYDTDGWWIYNALSDMRQLYVSLFKFVGDRKYFEITNNMLIQAWNLGTIYVTYDNDQFRLFSVVRKNTKGFNTTKVWLKELGDFNAETFKNQKEIPVSQKNLNEKFVAFNWNYGGISFQSDWLFVIMKLRHFWKLHEECFTAYTKATMIYLPNDDPKLRQQVRWNWRQPWATFFVKGAKIGNPNDDKSSSNQIEYQKMDDAARIDPEKTMQTFLKIQAYYMDRKGLIKGEDKKSTRGLDAETAINSFNSFNENEWITEKVENFFLDVKEKFGINIKMVARTDIQYLRELQNITGNTNNKAGDNND